MPAPPLESSQKTWILVPARNEAPRLARLLTALGTSLPGHPILVINGKSTDETPEIARSFGAEVQLQQGPGYPEAVQEGLSSLHHRGARQVLLLDGDGQHPADAGPRLIDGLERADWVIASRAGTKTPAPLPRRLGNLGLSWWVRALIGHRFGDLTSGFQAFGPRALAVFATRRPDGCADANLRVLGARSGLKILEIPVAMCDRIGGESMHQGLTGVRNYARSLRTSLALARRPD